MKHGRDGISFHSGKMLRDWGNMPPMSRSPGTMNHEMHIASVFVDCITVWKQLHRAPSRDFSFLAHGKAQETGEKSTTAARSIAVGERASRLKCKLPRRVLTWLDARPGAGGRAGGERRGRGESH